MRLLQNKNSEASFAWTSLSRVWFPAGCYLDMPFMPCGRTRRIFERCACSKGGVMTDNVSGCMQTRELLPCPFCGGEAKREPGSLGVFTIACEDDKCPANPVVSGVGDKATARWNRRASSPANDGWIAVTERLPDDHEMYLVWKVDKHGVSYCDTSNLCGDKSGFYVLYDDEGANALESVTHWRELPAPPTAQVQP